MVKSVNKILFLLLAALVAVSCAKEIDESERSVQQRILDSFVELNYPSATVKNSGLVIIDYVQGTGDTLDNQEAGYFEVTNQNLSGEYTETTDEELAKVLGWYANSNYYGPSFYDIGYESNYAGLEEAVTGLQVGGRVKFILPPWLTYTIDKESWNLTQSFIYDMELKEVIKEMYPWEEDTMRAYANIHYPGLDTTSQYFYFKKLHDAGADTLKQETVDVRYVGRLLDGWVFDTNIADTAKKYGIYDKTNDYEPLSVQFHETLEDMVEESSLVRGFCMALKEMSYGDIAFTMFYSEYGYKAAGSGEIGPYQPLTFWIYIEPED